MVLSLLELRAGWEPVAKHRPVSSTPFLLSELMGLISSLEAANVLAAHDWCPGPFRFDAEDDPGLSWTFLQENQVAWNLKPDLIRRCNGSHPESLLEEGRSDAAEEALYQKALRRQD